MNRSARTSLRATSKILFMGAILFLLLELSARVYLFGLAGLVPSRIDSVHGLPQTGFTRPSRHRAIGFELKPDVSGYFKLASFRTNSQGLRDREYPLRKPEKAFRVAVAGASFALPAGVEIEDAFHSLLEERLSRRLAPTRYEFINFAVGMYRPSQALATLELRALAYDPDLVLFTTTDLSTPWLVEDASTGAARTASRPKKPAGPQLFRRSHPILQSFFLRLLAVRTGHGPETPELHIGAVEALFMTARDRLAKPEPSPLQRVGRKMRPRPSPGSERDPASRRGGSVLERLARFGEEKGIPIVVVRLEFDASERLAVDLELERRTRELGMHYLDTRDAFRSTRARDFWIYELDRHPNGRAHEIFARTIASFLEAHDLLQR